MEKIKRFIHEKELRKWLPLIVLSIALTIIIIDTTVLNVSIRSILFDLNTTVQNIQWVISAYALTLAALTVTGGRLGDLFGRKKMFMVGAILFAAGSIITSFAPTIAWVIFGNAIIEGIGAALMMPATASLLVTNYRGKDRALAFAVWGGVAASAAATGPILGGYLTTNYSWRWAFRINILIVALLLAGARFIKEGRDKVEKTELDFAGIILSSIGLTSVVYALIESSTYGWWLSKESLALFGHSITPFGLSITPIALFIGIILLFAFALWENYHEKNGHTPLVSLKLFKNRQFTAGTAVTTFLALGQTGLIFSVPIFYQSVLNLDALHTGLGLVPLSLAVMIGAFTSLKLIKRLTPKHVIQLGFVINIVGALYLYSVISLESTPLSLAPGLALYGLGMGFAFSQLGNLTLSAVSVQQSGEASGVNSTLRQVGASFGSAIIGAILIATLTSSVVQNIEGNTTIPNTVKPQIISKIKEAGSNVEFQPPEQGTKIPEVIGNEINTAIHSATVDGNKAALLATAIFALSSLAVSALLPNIRDLETGKQATVSAH